MRPLLEAYLSTAYHRNLGETTIPFASILSLSQSLLPSPDFSLTIDLDRGIASLTILFNSEN